MSADKAKPISAAEAKSLFADLEKSAGIVLAVSGGPDSTALMWLAARWRKSTKARPKLIAVTVDHGLRRKSKKEAKGVRRQAKKFGVEHRTVQWSGAKPKTAIQELARRARYRLLADVAKEAGAAHVLTAHTLEDQAETVLMRMARGSGIAGLGAMARRSRLDGLILVRPFLDVPKARLIATLDRARVPYVEDPSNVDVKFTRVRWRELMPRLAREGLDARRLSILARRMRRADTAIEADVDRVAATFGFAAGDAAKIPVEDFAGLRSEIALRLLGRAMTRLGDEGPVELGKLETLFAAANTAVQKGGKAAFRRSLAGAIVTIAGGVVRVERAPARRKRRE